VTAAGQAFGIEVGITVELDDALGDTVCVSLLFIGVFEEFRGHGLRMNAFSSVVMAFVRENTNNLSGQGFVENLDDSLTIAFVSAGDGAVQDVLTGAFGCFFDVGDKRWLRFGHRLGGHNEWLLASRTNRLRRVNCAPGERTRQSESGCGSNSASLLLVGIGLVLHLLSAFLGFLCSLMGCLFSSALHGMAGFLRRLLRGPASILGRILGGVAGVLHILLGTLVFLALQKCKRRSNQRSEQENGESAFKYAH